MYRRPPAVSGTFYPSSPDELALAVLGYLEDILVSPALGVVSPHAGYIYSGRVQGALFSGIEVPQIVLLVGPNHRLGLRELIGKASIVMSGRFSTPLGDVEIDENMAELVRAGSEMIVEDNYSHAVEHSLEVQLPFLQVKREDVRIVPILLNLSGNEGHNAIHDFCRELGNCLASAIEQIDEDILIVASSDMNHYESREETGRKDRLALDRIESYDVASFLEVTEAENISACGRGAIATMMEACKKLGAESAEIVMYDDSGDVSGDLYQVVGYAGVIIK
jgi:AmmeMemoRadiSam system protein B